MWRADAAVWALASAGITAVEPDPSLQGFIRNAGVLGTVIMAAWLIESRVGKKIAGAIDAHTKIEDVWRDSLKESMVELKGDMKELHRKLDSRACAARSCKHTEG